MIFGMTVLTFVHVLIELLSRMVQKSLRLNFVFETISNHIGESNLGAFSTSAFDLPFTIVIDQAHFAA